MVAKVHSTVCMYDWRLQGQGGQGQDRPGPGQAKARTGLVPLQPVDEGLRLLDLLPVRVDVELVELRVHPLVPVSLGRRGGVS